MMPPASSCQPVNASTGRSDRQRRDQNVPAAMHTVPTSAAATPTMSHRAPGDSSSAAMPSTPRAPAANAKPGGRRWSSAQTSPITTSGPMAPTTAATPPGKR
ncbi:hypothetical protein D3C71_1750680 [compost metagenome]